MQVPRTVRAAAAAVLIASSCTGGGGGMATSTTAEPSTTTTTKAPTTAEEAGLRWWNDRVFYEVFVRSFKDSDGDGIGDLRGLTDSLDYLNDGDPSTTSDLGITGMWLMPVFASPSYHGYDVTDYRAVNPDYGTMEDFDAFLDAAHERGIAVVIDLVINHTSVEHPWFLASVAGEAPYADWYVWSETDPGTVAPWGGGSVWHPSGDRYYFGLFWEGMPDLNLENPAVTAEVEDIARFWLDAGVDGFRLDAARHLIEDGPVVADTPETVEWLERFTDFVHGVDPDAMVLGEVWSQTLEVARYVPAAIDLGFEFALAEAGGGAAQRADAAPLRGALERALGAYPEGQFATFLTNHDMDRIMSAVGGDPGLAALAATWLLTSPGVPFIYYGEEVGLQGTKPDERIRTPMPWNAEPPGLGFTTGDPWENVDSGYDRFNVAAEDADPGSLLNLYRTLIHYRNGSAALRFGDYLDVETGVDEVLAYVRSSGDDHVLVVLNLSPNPVSDYALDLAEAPLGGVRGALAVIGPQAVAPSITPRGGFLAYRPMETLPGHAAVVLSLTGEEQPPPPATTTTASTTTSLPDATESDAAVGEGFFGSVQEGPTAWLAYVADDAVVTGGGQAVSIHEQLPPDAGVFDWDVDGIVTIVDLISQQFAWAGVVSVDPAVECAPEGARVVCSFSQQDVFFDAAGVEAPPLTQGLVVRDGAVVEIAESSPGDDAAAYAAWLEKVAAYEQWVADTYPEDYPNLFRGPCCSPNEFTVIVGPGTLPRHRVLIPEWIEAAP